MRAVTYYDGAIREGVLVASSTGIALRRGPAESDIPRLDGIVTGLYTDHHVHLQLIDPGLLPSSRLGRVIDLGGNPAVLSAPELCATALEYAGPFLTAVGGYPSDRAWAPAGSVWQVQDAEDAATGIAELAAAGVSCIKVAGNSDAGPVLSDELFRVVVQEAARFGLPVVAHAEGQGQAQRVIRLGATRLAHAPFSERLTDEEIAEQAASASWISTMAIHTEHAYEIVIDNVRRFIAASGQLCYGSDMGNGDAPVDLRENELAALHDAGVTGEQLLRALAPLDPHRPESALLIHPVGDPAKSRRLTPTELET